MTAFPRAIGLLTAAAVVSLASVHFFGLSGGRGRGDLNLLVLAGLFGSIDLCDLMLRLHINRRRSRRGNAPGTSVRLDVGEFTAYQVRLHVQPYALVASVYNAEEELDDFLEEVRPYRDRLWVIDDASTDETYGRLQHAGLRTVRGTVNRKKPGAIKELVDRLDPEIVTVMVIDPDSRILDRVSNAAGDLERVIFEFQRSGLAAVCPRLTVREDGLLGHFQQLEYFLAFGLGRHSLVDHSITSGISIYRRDALERALARHSLSVYAEDLKNALLLLADGERIYYDGRLTVETAGKRSWAAWFSQRVGWYFGLIKVYIEAFPDLRLVSAGHWFYRYHFIVYTGVVGILLHPLRVAAAALQVASLVGGVDGVLGLGLVPSGGVNEPVYFLIAYLQSTVLVGVGLLCAVPSGLDRRRLLPIAPVYFFYVLCQTLPITVGYLNWFSLRFLGRRVYRDHFQDDATLCNELRRSPL